MKFGTCLSVLKTKSCQSRSSAVTCQQQPCALMSAHVNSAAKEKFMPSAPTASTAAFPTMAVSFFFFLTQHQGFSVLQNKRFQPLKRHLHKAKRYVCTKQHIEQVPTQRWRESPKQHSEVKRYMSAQILRHYYISSWKHHTAGLSMMRKCWQSFASCLLYISGAHGSCAQMRTLHL